MKFLSGLFKNKELRVRILFTLLMLLIYRLGTVIPVPNVDVAKITAGIQSNTLVEMLNLLSGGNFQSLSIFSLGVGPYITASIIIQLLSMEVIPHFHELSKAGQKGRNQLEKYTRYLGIVLGYVQAITLIIVINKQSSVLLNDSISSYFFMATIMTAGTMFLMWLGDQITSKGVGNGISLIIFSGIVSNLPAVFVSAWNNITAAGTVLSYVLFALYVVVYIAIVVLVIFMNGAVRKITIQNTRSIGTSSKGGNTSHLPLMINSASVIPVIFASAILQAPIVISSWFNQSVYQFLNKWFALSSPTGLILYAILIILFTFFYTHLQVDPEQIADNFSKNGSYIPGVRPGKDTEKYISTVLNRITVFGAAFLTFIALLPYLLPIVTNGLIPQTTAPGGTGIIIVVGVALETVKELKGRMAKRTYSSFLGM